MPDPVDEVLEALVLYQAAPYGPNREQLRKALIRWMRREIRSQVLDGEGYPG